MITIAESTRGPGLGGARRGQKEEEGDHKKRLLPLACRLEGSVHCGRKEGRSLTVSARYAHHNCLSREREGKVDMEDGR
jgi:hypothetical protein